MTYDDDELIGDDDDAVISLPEGASAARDAESDAVWKVLLVDDEPDVHAVTRMSLGGMRVDNVPVRVLSATSRDEAEVLLEAHHDIALAILDVVMETEDAGLLLAKRIRDRYPDRSTRLVLRTGQPGLAPEEQVLREYDINDYWAKTELTAMRMRTLVTGNLRSCRDLRTIESHRHGLTRVIESTESLFKRLGVESLVQAILDHLATLLPTRNVALFFIGRAGNPPEPELCAQVLGATGRFAAAIGKEIHEVLDGEPLAMVQSCIEQGAFVFHDKVACFGFRIDGQPSAAIFMDTAGPLSAMDRHMVELFCRNAAIAFHNQCLTEERLAVLAAVSRFVPTGLLHLLGHTDIRRVQLGAHEDRELTVLFGDLHAFTRMAERMSSAHTFALLAQFHAAIGPAIARHGGVVDKYLGDGIMVLFPGPDGPAHCVAAGADVLRALATMNHERVAAGEPPLVLSLGAHHGAVTVGTLGFAERLETTVVGDAVNVAARVEQLARQFRSSLCISEQVHERLPGSLRDDCRGLGTIAIRGREGRLRIYDAFHAATDRDARASTKARFEAALGHLEAAQWRDAIVALDEVLRATPDDGAAAVLRTQALAALPPS